MEVLLKLNKLRLTQRLLKNNLTRYLIDNSLITVDDNLIGHNNIVWETYLLIKEQLSQNYDLHTFESTIQGKINFIIHKFN